MAWNFYSADGTQAISQLGTLAITRGGTGSVTAAGALEALGAGITDNPTFATAIATTAFLPDAADGATLGTAALEFSDLFLADGAVINLGADQDITFTHVHNTGVLLNSTSKIQFGDAGTFIHQSADGVLTIESDTTVDINGAVVFNGSLSGVNELAANSLDIWGNADIDGTLEADIITVDGVALSTYIRDTVGTNMLSSNTESGIAVTYDTSNDNIDFALDVAQTSITSIYNTGLTVGRDTDNFIDFADADNEILFKINDVYTVKIGASLLAPKLNDVAGLGNGTLMWSDLFLANGGVINFYNGNLTITHSSNTLTVAGGTFATGALTTTTIVASDRIKTDSTSDASTTLNGSLQTDGGLSVVKDAVFGDDVTLLSDGAVLAFGADKDVTLVHDDGTGLLLNGTNKLTFYNTNQFIQGSNSTTLSLAGAAEIDLTATLIDINGNADISGTTTFNTVAYSWPSSQGAASTNLQNNGSGALTWVAASAGVSMDVVLTLGG